MEGGWKTLWPFLYVQRGFRRTTNHAQTPLLILRKGANAAKRCDTENGCLTFGHETEGPSLLACGTLTFSQYGKCDNQSDASILFTGGSAPASLDRIHRAGNLVAQACSHEYGGVTEVSSSYPPSSWRHGKSAIECDGLRSREVRKVRRPIDRSRGRHGWLGSFLSMARLTLTFCLAVRM